MRLLSRRFCWTFFLAVLVGAAVGCSPVGAPDDGVANVNSNTDTEGPGSDPDAGGNESDMDDPGTPGEEDPADGDPGEEDPSDGDPGEQPGPAMDALPDFTVLDVNPASARFQEVVSPRDYVGQVSAWYFGHST